ncbi:egg cell-secreted protein 1.2-like [Herrania umbratica]|uniref:Egg cell-secreted protein 1.2-like n=1 Tax=Herrania umbratica TaxID=108875 RepID=A0A6J1AVW9_9ROSI|nr:egg cell-secreted protein 1.2-like [Herrania umbratica]
MAGNNVFLLLFMVCLSASGATATRELNGYSKAPGHNIAARLDEASLVSVNCWNVLYQFTPCGIEIVRFFINGRNGIIRDCCNAIQDMEHCEPGMLISLGFSYEEEKALISYCDASLGRAAAPLAASPLSAEAFI